MKNKYLTYLKNEQLTIPMTIRRLEREQLGLFNDETCYLSQEKAMQGTDEEDVKKYLAVLKKQLVDVREAQKLIAQDITLLREREKNIGQAIVCYSEREKIKE